MVSICSYIHYLMEDVFSITFPSVVSYESYRSEMDLLECLWYPFFHACVTNLI